MLLKTILRKSIAVALALPLALAAEDKADLAAIYKIKNEAFQNSKVMDHMFHLTDVHGPRLTGSPGYRAAAEWVVKRLGEYGISAKLEKWGPFGRGWTYTRYSAHMLEPGYTPLIGFPLAWTGGTNGVVTGEPIHVTLATEADLEKNKGKLKGRIVLMAAARDLSMNTTPLARRYNEDELAQISLMPEPGGGRGGRAGGPGGQFGGQQEFRNKLNQFLQSEQPALILQPATRGDGGTIFASGGGPRNVRDVKSPIPPAQVALTPEHYNRIVRLLNAKVPVKLEFDVQTKFFDEVTDSWNVIGEIPGGKKKDEIVMVGAHLDSWHGGTGATDNAVGSAVMIEVMRILKSLNTPLDRSIRIGLWGGEEQGLLGSRAYVTEHFADRATMKLGAEHSKFSGYFNIDNGTGKVRGIYLQGNDMVRPVFEAWMKPFADLGMTTITNRNTGGTDHQSFDAVGLPGFQFIQDPAEYDTRTHHSNMDVYDRIQRGDLMQIAAIVASYTYHTAMREEMLPRKPLPKPQPGGGRGGRGGGQTDNNQ